MQGGFRIRMKDPVMSAMEGLRCLTPWESIQNNTAIVLCKIDVEQVIERRNAYGTAKEGSGKVM